MEKIARFFIKLGKILYVNLLWVIFSIPLVTAGASTAAAFYVMLKIVDDEKIQIWKLFVKGFTSNFKQGTLMFIISAISIGGTVFFWRYIIQEDAGTGLKILAVAVSAVVLALNLYTFPLIARYENSFKNTLKNAMVIFLQYLYSSVIISVLLAVEVFVWSLNFWTIVCGLFIIPGLMIFTESTFVKKTFLAIENL